MKNIWFNGMALLAMAIMVGITGCSDAPQSKTLALSAPSIATPADTVGVFVVIDGSGSMAENVTNSQGQQEQKWEIAKRAMVSVGNRLDTYLQTASGRKIALGVVLFKDAVVSLDSLTVMTSSNSVTSFLQDAVTHFGTPAGGTPIGDAITFSAKHLLSLPIKSKHIMIITDGDNTVGPSPESVWVDIRNQFAVSGCPLGLHFVAFDVAASKFNSIKQMGATVVGASNENELKSKLDSVLKDKILLERED